MNNDCKHILSLEGISAAYNNKTVLHDINLNIYSHDFLGIIGPNGGGKTTLIKVILGLLKSTTGVITYFSNGQPVDHLTMGYLPQCNNIDKNFPVCVKEVVLSGLCSKKTLTSSFNRQQQEKADYIIARMGLEALAKRHIGQLSGGQLQRALLGRAMISDPQLLILDEPSTYIDKQFESRLYELLTDINKDCAIILVSHDIGTVLQNVKSIACVNETLHYHPDTGITNEWLEQNFHCPIDVLGHGTIAHRVLGEHQHREG